MADYIYSLNAVRDPEGTLVGANDSSGAESITTRFSKPLQLDGDRPVLPQFVTATDGISYDLANYPQVELES